MSTAYCRAAGDFVSCVAGKELNLAEDVFKLGHLLEANILAKREIVEDLASAALKEEAIEKKLAGIAAEWGELTLTFQDYKSRGAVVLKVGVVLARLSWILQRHVAAAW